MQVYGSLILSALFISFVADARPDAEALATSGPQAFVAADLPPVVSTGGNSGVDYRVDCNNTFFPTGPVTSVQLDGSGSYDPDGTPVTFFWHNECTYGYFDDPTSATPVYHVDMANVCSRECWIALRVSSGGVTTIKGFQVFVDDVTPPSLSIPSDYFGIWGDSTDVATTGSAYATDNCDPTPSLTFADVAIPATGPGQPELVLQRTWLVRDCKQMESSAVQTIRLLATTGGPGSTANLDFDPQQCPNLFSLSMTGTVEVHLLGAASFRAEKVIPGSLRLWVREAPGICIVPSSILLRDVGSITATNYGECNSTTKDGRQDLRLRFDRLNIAAQFDLGRFSGQTIEVMVTGNLTAGSKLFATRDFITVQ